MQARTYLFFLIVAFLTGCHSCSEQLPPPSCPPAMDLTAMPTMACADFAMPPPPADLLPPRCLAAQGLDGELLAPSGSAQPLCIDFAGFSGDISMLTSVGWNFHSTNFGCSGFSITGEKLVPVLSSSVRGGDCTFRLPNIAVPSGISRVMISIIHSAPLSASPTQHVSISPAAAGSIYTVSGADITESLMVGVFGPTGSTFQGALGVSDSDTATARSLPAWSIDSIAVIGLP